MNPHGSSATGTTATTALLAVAHRAVDAALDVIAGRQPGRGDIAHSTKSTSTDIVTEFDTAAESAILDVLLTLRPDDGVLGEEGAARPGSSGIRWVVDPIDGTTNFLYEHPSYGISVAAENSEGALVGVVHDISRGERFAASRDDGATLDGRPIAVGPPVPFAQALVATGFGYDPGHRRHQAEVVAALIGEIRDIRRSGAASLDLCAVACGRVDAYYEVGLQPWDYAAGSLIATEAGAWVRSIGGGPVDGDDVIAARPELGTELAARLRELGALDATRR